MTSVYGDNEVSMARRALSHLSTSISGRKIEDYAPFFDLLGEDVIFEHAEPGGSGKLSGKAALVDYVTRWYRELADPSNLEDVELTRPIEFYHRGDRVVALWAEASVDKNTRVRGPSKEAVAIFDFLDNKIVRLRKFAQ